MINDNLKDELENLVSLMIDDLYTFEDGTSITTLQLIQKVDYEPDEFSENELHEIHGMLFQKAEEVGIVLDMSQHEYKLEGLPYNLDFIVHNKNAKIRCPRCGSEHTAEILYGMPAFSEELKKKMDSGEVVLGGCEIVTVPVNGRVVQLGPERYCNTCKKNFGTPPLLIAKDKESAEDYRDIVTSIKFSVGGFFGGFTKITLVKDENGASVTVQESLLRNPEECEPGPIHITVDEWNQILNRLYLQLYLHEWKHNFEDPCVLDGTQWDLRIKLTNGRVRNYGGSNAFPPYWRDLIKIFQQFVPIK